MYSSGVSTYKLTRILNNTVVAANTQGTADTNDVISELRSRAFGSSFLKWKKKLRHCKEKCDAEPSIQNIEELESLQANYDELFDCITLGAIIRSRATWYEKGEKNNKHFLNLEKSNKKKSCVRKILTCDETLTMNPKTIFSELELFFRSYTKPRTTRNQKGNCALS